MEGANLTPSEADKDGGRGYVYGSPNVHPDGFSVPPAAERGDKASGLFRLPPEWYPPCVVISSRLHDDSPSGSREEKLAGLLGGQEVQSLFNELSSRSTTGQLLVRSSAERETINERGQYLSVISSSKSEDVAGALISIWAQAEVKSEGKAPSIGALVQTLIPAEVTGHLSNEYRLSRESWRWTVEFHRGHNVEEARWRVNSSPPATDMALQARGLDGLEDALRAVAARLSDIPFRHHLEWVWDATRLWIVQADRVPPVVGPAPGDKWVPVQGQFVASDTLQRWHQVDMALNADEDDKWPKIKCLRQFQAAQLPVPILWRLTGQAISELAAGSCPAGLMDDLRAMCSGPIVVRTDVNDGDDLLKERTEAVTDPQAVLSFLQNASRRLVSEGHGVASIAFLAHRFIRARGGAWTWATPGGSQVRIDSTWGLNDGLAWLPHDSAWVNLETGHVSRYVNGKTTFLDVVDDEGRWEYRETPTEWIWRSSVTEDQLRMMAAGAARLSNQASAPLVTMWFVGLLDGAEAECLPWFQAAHVPSDFAMPRLGQDMRRLTVRRSSDLDEIPEGRYVLRLEPEKALIRDETFVDRVINVARNHDLPVEIVGSPLAHPYYMLQKAGVAVTCFDSPEPPSMQFHKLVRDNVPEQIASRGEDVITYRVSDEERKTLLRDKLVEEALEVFHSRSADDLLEELADVVEVLEALRRANGISRDMLRASVKKKNSSHGAYNRSMFLVQTGLGEKQGQQLALPDLEIKGAVRPWQARQKGRQVHLSYVPPGPGTPMPYEFAFEDHKVRVTYHSDSIEVELLDAASPQVQDVQLPFL